MRIAYDSPTLSTISSRFDQAAFDQMFQGFDEDATILGLSEEDP